MKKDPWWLRLGVDLFVRAIYFMGGMVAAFFALVCYLDGTLLVQGWLCLVLCVVIGLFAAIFGPNFYEDAVMRGRGKLKEIRAMSRRQPLPKNSKQ
ncbi:MAG TPA: hypothetical protein PLI09_20355 [Candidatus Hydrogenedentes bacterium]|nr:hypothetical protein [Candidatus Hydrogenedentota bacterium]